MRVRDLDGVIAIAANLAKAPQWGRPVYERAVLGNGVRIALVAEMPGEVVGFAVALVIAPEAELESIGVAADCQRRGVGRGLLGELLRRLTEAHVTALDLEVRESNQAAVEFYARSGFREIGRRIRYYRDPVEDALLLRFVLGSGSTSSNSDV